MGKNRNSEDSGLHLKGSPSARMVAACKRTVEIHDRVRIAADRCVHAIDDLTQTGPIPLSEEDSIVTTLETLIEERKNGTNG